MKNRIKHTITQTHSNELETDLSFYNCGIEECKPNHHRSGVKDHYLIHYILSGKGIYKTNDKSYLLTPNTGFLISPNIPYSYTADNTDPWYYCWFGFHSTNASAYLNALHLNIANPIFSYDKNNMIIENVQKLLDKGNRIFDNYFFTKGVLYDILSELYESTSATQYSTLDIKNQNTQELYLEKSIEYVSKNYSNKLTVEDLAQYIGINRRYLYRIFKAALDMSPQQYLQEFRINKACNLLTIERLNVGDVAQSVGYDNALVFSKIFKKKMGMSPTNYRKSL